MRRDVEDRILQALDAFVEAGKRLPATSDGKVNVAALCRDLGLRTSDVQHIFRKEAVKTAVSALALDQDLLPVGARAEREAADQACHKVLAKAKSSARRDAQAAAEQSAGALAILAELASTKSEVEGLRLANEALRARIHMFEEGRLVPDFDVG